MSITPPFRYINANELASMIKAAPSSEVKNFAVVDVRSDDFVGGNIVNCINSPAETFHVDVDGLLQKLDGVPKVIFRELPLFPLATWSIAPGDCLTIQTVLCLNNARIYSETLTAEQKKNQEVYVLRDGFTGFQQKFRNDPILVEKFSKRYHD